MLIHLQNVCPPEQVEHLRKVIEGGAFSDGGMTAGAVARVVKSNEQLETGAHIDTVRTEVRKALMAHAGFVSFARPKTLSRILVSRYLPGMEYGPHVDDALMGGRRADLSFTLFLSDPLDYDGGALVMDGTDGETEIKLAAGDAVVYATSAIHHVVPVTRGERLAVVGWVRSLVRRPDQREVLFDLDQVSNRLFERHGKTRELDLVLKTKANLLRQWAED
ncbi:PKHD-type hydroxylase [Maricaulis sp. W15]|uniref:Fe2+-dependent dioxygenase n=1 Tax=Maricaulis sp. W15 TaxID=1772333 RepID=UPI000948E954|nr:Fe2+-dependent dioxygenase [Maricaulis sp. W15]OLF77851.1 PKHD-type hydroxylase [Maricaulis sp. W15]